mgnify:CR=1 FL=1
MTNPHTSPAWGPYLAERFPVPVYLVLVSAMTLAALSAAAVATGAVLVVWPVTPIATLAILLGFFVLRVFDEHKDSGKDALAHPARVLSRGLITLSHLAAAGWGAAAVSVALAGTLGLHAALWMAASLGFAVLMRYEFFVGTWLQKHLVLYALTHNPVVALLMMVPVAGVLQGTAFPNEVLLWLAIASVSSLGAEVGRKLRAPADENPNQDTYTQALGVVPASLFVTAVHLGTGALALGSVMSLGPRLAIGIATSVATIATLRFGRAPSSRGAKIAEAGAMLLAFVVYVSMIVDVSLRFGIAWR